MPSSQARRAHRGRGDRARRRRRAALGAAAARGGAALRRGAVRAAAGARRPARGAAAPRRGAGAGAAAARRGAVGARRRCPRPRPRCGSAREPTASICPTSPPSASTLPCTGDGISTVALSVITSASTWSSTTVSPGLHVPGDELDFGDAFADVGHLDDVNAHAAHASIARLNAAPTRSGPGEVGPLLRMRIGRVPAGDALDRRFEVVEAVLLHQRRQLGAEAAGARRLVHDHAAAGLLHRVDDRVAGRAARGCAGR